MSMATQNVAPVLGPDVRAIVGTAAEVRKPRKRVYKARVATKVKWALGDAMDRSIDAQRKMQKILVGLEEARTLAEATADPRLLTALGRLYHDFADLALGVAELERGLVRAIAECKPEVKAKKKYSEL